MYVCTATRDQLILCTDCYVLLSKCYFELNIEDDLKPNIKMYLILADDLKPNIKNVFDISNFIIYISVNISTAV